MKTHAPVPYSSSPAPIPASQRADFCTLPKIQSRTQEFSPPPRRGPCHPYDSESEPGELGRWCLGHAKWGDGGAVAEEGRRQQRDVARVRAAAARERGLRKKRRRRGPWPPLPGPRLPSRAPSGPRGAPGAARRRERRRGAAAGPARQPGGRQPRRPRRRRAGRVRTAGAPDLAGGGVSKALCLMASLFTEFTF